MSAQTYEPLRLAPPLEQHGRMAWLLTVRRLARRARDAALAAPRSAAGYVGRLYHSTRLTRLGSWLHRLTGRLTQPLLTVTSRLGKTGIIAGLLTLATSPTTRRLLQKAGGSVGRALSWLGRTAYSVIDFALRWFGKPGSKVADALFAGLVAAGGRIGSLAAPVVRRVARFSDPQAPHIRVLAGISRSYFLHRVLKALISNGLVRVLVEGLAVPALIDSKVAQWVRRQIGILHARAMGLQEQALRVSQLPAESLMGRPGGANNSSARLRPERPTATVDQSTLDEDLEPSNRAERRAQQRHINRQGRNPA